MTRIKNVLSVVLCISMLLSCIVPVEAADCEHTSVSNRKPITMYQPSSEAWHIVMKGYSGFCNGCNDYVIVVTSSDEEHHSFSDVDLGHGGFMHQYRRNCQQCGYSCTVWVECDGRDPHQKP